MISSLLSTLRRRKESADLELGALSEGLDFTHYIKSTKINVHKDPFPHIIIDDFFSRETAVHLSAFFTEVLNRGTAQQPDPTKFSPFVYSDNKHEYDGYVYTPRYDEDPSLALFFSATWNQFFSKLFHQPTGLCTSFSFHYHPPGNRTGFTHSDYAFKYFSPLHTTHFGSIYKEQNGGTNLLKTVRVIALIYYLKNDDWSDGDGGETGLYQNKGTVPVKLIEPINNRLFAFNISPHSLHAFQQNQKRRSSIIQWFHVDPDWCRRKYGFLPGQEKS